MTQRRASRWVMIVAVCSACGTERKAASAPTPTPTPTPVEPAQVAKPGSGKAPAPGERCTTQLMIGGGKITYDDGGVERSVPFQSERWPEFPRARPFDGACVATIWADDAIPYQDVINVMDALIQRGVLDIGIGEPGDEPATVEAPPRRSESRTARLQAAPVLALTRTEATINGVRIGNVDDPALDELVAAKAPPKPADPIIILQGDKTLRFGVIRRAVKGARVAGYTEVLFATKNKQ